MAVENFTSGWTEADPDAKLSQTSATASATTLNALSSNETHLYKDLGAGAYPGDYGPFRFTCVATAQSSSNGRGCFFSISPILPAVATGTVVYEQSTRVWWNNGTLYLSHWQDANNTFTADAQDTTALSAVALNTTFYCELQRASGTVTCKVYSDSGYSTLVDTLSISPANTYSHRYVIVTAKQSSGSGATLTFETSNLDLSPVSGLTFGNVENTDWKYVDSSVVAASVNVPIPACSAGDLVVIVGYIDSATASFSTPTDFAVGFTGTNAEGGLGIFTKTVTGSEGWGGGSGTVTLSRSGGSDALIQAISLRLTGHNTTTPYNVGAQATATGGSNWNSPSITTTSNGSILFFGGGSRDVAGTFDVGDEPDTTTLIKQWATSGSWLGLAYEAQTTAGATGTRQWTNPTNAKRAFSFAIAPASASGLTITSVTPSSFDDGKTGIVIAGSGFGASQGSSTLTIGGQAQTVTAWSDTSITFTSVRGSVSPGNATLTLTKG